MFNVSEAQHKLCTYKIVIYPPYTTKKMINTRAFVLH